MRENLRNLHDAARYDAYASTAMGPWDALLVERAVAVCPSLPGPRCAIDVGTGTGVIPELLAARREFDGFDLLGLEFFDDMVAQARRRVAAGAHARRVRIMQGDAHALPLPDDVVDLLLCRATLHHLADPIPALIDMARVLKPGGVAVIHDPRRDAPPDVLAAFNAMRAEVGYKPTTLAEKFTLAEAEALVVDAGLAEAATVSSGDGLAALGFEILVRRPA